MGAAQHTKPEPGGGVNLGGTVKDTMPRTCTICSHAKREEIDAALVGGESLRNIAQRFGTSTTALHRHKSDHIAPLLAKAEDMATDSLLCQVRKLQRKALGILAKAEKAGDLRTALGAIREARGNLELLAKLMGELPDLAINVLIMPEWGAIRAVLLSALMPYPEARAAVAGALLELEGAHVSG